MLAEAGHLAGVLGASIAAYIALPLKRDTPRTGGGRRSALLAGAALAAAGVVSLDLPHWTTGLGLWMAGLMVAPAIVVLVGPRLQAGTLWRSALGATAISAGIGLYGCAS